MTHHELTGQSNGGETCKPRSNAASNGATTTPPVIYVEESKETDDLLAVDTESEK